jgi:GT2 family glycosyltransferase
MVIKKELESDLLKASAFETSQIVESAWIGHNPFANWLIRNFKPSLLVELGTHNGNSYFTFCQSIVEAELKTKCFAVDTWQGDEHAGIYDDKVYEEVSRHNQSQYSSFSELIRSTFDSTVDRFEDGTIDLLHIDGLHTYEAVKHDFETWRTKVSKNGLILFHDICVRERGFGVWKLWSELIVEYPNHFEFDHAYGLGVLNLEKDHEHHVILDLNEIKKKHGDIFSAFGKHQCNIQELQSRNHEIGALSETVASRDGQIALIQGVIAEKESVIAEKEGVIAGLNEEVASREGQIQDLVAKVSEKEGVIAAKDQIIIDSENQLLEKKEAFAGLSSKTDKLRESLSLKAQQIEGLQRDISEKDNEIGALSEAVGNRDRQISGLQRHIAEKENVISQRDHDLQHIRSYLDLVKSSLSWRLTAPLRRVQEKVKSVVQTLKRYRLAAWIIWTHRKTGVFDPEWYLQSNPDVREKRINPWWHFAMYGLYEGRAPHEGFDVAYYADNNQDIASAFTNPLLHYALWGYSENRPWRAPSSNIPTGELDIKVPRALGRLAQPPIERLSAYPQRQWPLISVVMPTYNTPITFLDRAIESVRTQKYPYWELCIVDDSSPNEDVRARLIVQAASDTRIKLVFNTQNRGISCSTNSAVAVATGSFCAFLDHDDELAPEALAEVAVAILENPDADVVYTDQDKIDEDGIRFEPFHKPAWSPIYLQGVMYIGHLLVVRTEVLHKVGGCDSRYDKIQDFELMLRLHEVGAEVIHIPKILYHWRTLPGSIAASTDAKGNIESLQAAAVQSHLDRQRLPLQTKAHPSLPHRIQLFSAAKSDPRLVSIIIPTKDAPEHIRRCLDTLFGMTRGCSFEVIIADTGTTDSDAIEAQNTYPIKRIECPGPFNFSRVNNIAAREAKGEFLLFLNNDTEVVDPDWLLTLLAHHSLPNVGAVGPILIYPNGEVQHAGVAIGARGTADHILRHVNPMCDGYAGSLPCAREVSAVTAACMMMPSDLFMELGGFNEDYARHYQDTDLCLRIREAGRSILHVGNVILKHHESVSRGGIYDMVDRAIFQDRWFSILTEGDPFYNPNFKLDLLNYTLR